MKRVATLKRSPFGKMQRSDGMRASETCVEPVARLYAMSLAKPLCTRREHLGVSARMWSIWMKTMSSPTQEYLGLDDEAAAALISSRIRQWEYNRSIVSSGLAGLHCRKSLGGENRCSDRLSSRLALPSPTFRSRGVNTPSLIERMRSGQAGGIGTPAKVLVELTMQHGVSLRVGKSIFGYSCTLSCSVLPLPGLQRIIS